MKAGPEEQLVSSLSHKSQNLQFKPCSRFSQIPHGDLSTRLALAAGTILLDDRVTVMARQLAGRGNGTG